MSKTHSIHNIIHDVKHYHDVEHYLLLYSIAHKDEYNHTKFIDVIMCANRKVCIIKRPFKTNTFLKFVGMNPNLNPFYANIRKLNKTWFT